VSIPGMKGAAVCRTFFHGKRTIFQFADLEASHIYGEYGDVGSPTPEGCLGAILMRDGSWKWVVQEKRHGQG